MITRLDFTSADPATNLAMDEAMLEAAEAGEGGERLRLWQFGTLVAVVGRGSAIHGEVDLVYCQRQNIPVFRRCSGGAAIAAGQGCLMYSLVLSMQKRPELRRLDVAHRFVMQTLAAGLSWHLPGVSAQGICDLTWHDRKFSGNSVRVARDHLLYHGTLFYDADLDTISAALRMPPRRPDYRQDRDHRSFLTNVPLAAEVLREAVSRAFEADENTDDAPLRRAQRLVAERYERPEWTYRH